MQTNYYQFYEYVLGWLRVGFALLFCCEALIKMIAFGIKVQYSFLTFPVYHSASAVCCLLPCSCCLDCLLHVHYFVAARALSFAMLQFSLTCCFSVFLCFFIVLEKTGCAQLRSDSFFQLLFVSLSLLCLFRITSRISGNVSISSLSLEGKSFFENFHLLILKIIEAETFLTLNFHRTLIIFSLFFVCSC